MKLGNIMILGDSYSTYEGYIPAGYDVYYSGHRTEVPDVFDVKKTWWGRMLEENDAKLVLNNSWSGSPIGYTGYNNADCSHTSSFIYRFEKLLNEGFFDRNKIDTLFVFGGTNDSGADAPLGVLKYDDIQESDLFCALPAISYLAKRVKENLKGTRIIFIGNHDIKKEITDGMESVCKHYDIEYVPLSAFDKINGHPTEQGMKDIYEQIITAIA